MASKFEELKQAATNLKSKLMCQSSGHKIMELEEQAQGHPDGYMKVTTVCSRCGTQLENPQYRWKV